MVNNKQKDVMLKTVTIFLIIYLVITLTLYMIGRVSPWVFWGSLIFVAVYSTYIMPIVKKKL
ncbi:hypothetical protein H6503_06005 [Candidatus Woesearchaeota archaeon]|nr:hypothetical protein [Candidatus Woesearchaeota archaeon]